MTNAGTNPLVKWARGEAARVRGIRPEGVGAHSNTVRPNMAAAMEFLRRHAPGTQFLATAEALVRRDEQIGSGIAIRGMADLIDDWANFVEAGMAEMPSFEVAARVAAANDLMEQVQALLDDQKVTPAAPVMLAGAALEEFLRSRVALLAAVVAGRPSISSYASALRTAGDLSAQDVKDITSWGGQRNEAAHGEFDKLSRQRAQLMVDGINLFIRQKTS